MCDFSFRKRLHAFSKYKKSLKRRQDQNEQLAAPLRCYCASSRSFLFKKRMCPELISSTTNTFDNSEVTGKLIIVLNSVLMYFCTALLYTNWPNCVTVHHRHLMQNNSQCQCQGSQNIKQCGSDTKNFATNINVQYFVRFSRLWTEPGASLSGLLTDTGLNFSLYLKSVVL